MPPGDDLVVSVAATDVIAAAYSSLEESFDGITALARQRFEERDWVAVARDALERLTLHGPAALDTARQMTRLLGDRAHDREIWARIKEYYGRFADQRPDFELAKTFYNSVNRRVLPATGVDPDIQFVDADFDTPPGLESIPSSDVLSREGPLRELVQRVLEGREFTVTFADLERDSGRVSDRIVAEVGSEGDVLAIELVKRVFYRGKGAYLVGRVLTVSGRIPLAIALVHGRKGIAVDAVLLTENDVSILFSFAHSYFHVQSDHPRDLVEFINEIVPRKRPSELYISLGWVRHGKSELFRELRDHLRTSGEVFVEAAGKKGLVMSVFTLPGFEVVLKVIRDNIPPQKLLTPSQVMEKYLLVFRHDRAGRLVDSQYFERLEFPTDRFEPSLLESLLTECSRSVSLHGDSIEISLAYVQRRVVPLDVYLKKASPWQAAQAVVDYGQAIRDLAVSGIFPGDLLLKNFGVTRNDRVVFYDYDELTEIGRITFRDMPVATNIDDELAATPWFPLGPEDVFPSEFASFLGLPPGLRTTFMDHHSDLLEASWWNHVKDRVEAGDILSIYPYTRDLRV